MVGLLVLEQVRRTGFRAVDDALRIGSNAFGHRLLVRFRPDTGALEPQSGPTQFGRNRDNWGRWFGTQNSNPLWHYVLPDHYLARNPAFAAEQTLVQLLTPANFAQVQPYLQPLPRDYPVRVKCATLAWHTLVAALDNTHVPVATE